MSKNTRSVPAGPDRPMAFEEIEHTADRALRIFGKNFEELLINAARGMNSLMFSEPNFSSERQRKFVEIDAMDAETLLVEWLSELSYWAEVGMLIFHEFEMESVSATHLKATIYGNRVKQLEKHIKAVTYHNLEIIQTEKGLITTVVFDV